MDFGFLNSYQKSLFSQSSLFPLIHFLWWKILLRHLQNWTVSFILFMRFLYEYFFDFWTTLDCWFLLNGFLERLRQLFLQWSHIGFSRMRLLSFLLCFLNHTLLFFLFLFLFFIFNFLFHLNLRSFFIYNFHLNLFRVLILFWLLEWYLWCMRLFN